MWSQIVQFKVDTAVANEYSCGECKSYVEGFCYRWTFPIREIHVPCTKFKLQEKEQDGNHNVYQYTSDTEEEVSQEELDTQSINQDDLVPEITHTNGLLQEFFERLKIFKEEIIGKSFDEIYIMFDGILEEYESKFKIWCTKC